MPKCVGCVCGIKRISLLIIAKPNNIMNEFEYKYYKHVSPNGILVVTNDGELIEVNCPFRVKAKTNFPKIKSGTDIWVQRIYDEAYGKR